MTSLERATRPAAWAEPPAAVRFVLGVWTVAEVELQDLAHDPTGLLTRVADAVAVIADSRPGVGVPGTVGGSGGRDT